MARRLDSAQPGFAAAFDALLAERRGVAEDVDREAAAIVDAVRTARRRGAARLHRALRQGRAHARAASPFGGRGRRPGPPRRPRPCAMRWRQAAARIEAFHRRLMPADLDYRDEAGRQARRPLAPAGCGRALRPGRHRRLSQHRADERDPRAGRGRRPHRDGRADAGRRARCHGDGRRRDRRRHRDLPRRRGAGDRGAGPRHRDHRAGRQDRGPRQRLGRRRQAARLRHRRHRHDRGAVGDPRGGGRRQRAGLDRRGPALPGRARRRRPGHPDHRRRGLRGTGGGGGRARTWRGCRARTSPPRAGAGTARSSCSAPSTRRRRSSTGSRRSTWSSPWRSLRRWRTR